jgi:hypothetical protein
MSISEYINSKSFIKMVKGLKSDERTSMSVYKSISKYVESNPNIIDSQIEVCQQYVELSFKLSDEHFFHMVL